MSTDSTTRERPARGELLTLDVESLAYGGRGVARGTGPRGRPGVARSGSAPLRPRRRALPRGSLAGARLRAAAAPQALAGGRCAHAHRGSRGLRARADRTRARALALSQQARVLLR